MKFPFRLLISTSFLIAWLAVFSFLVIGSVRQYKALQSKTYRLEGAADALSKRSALTVAYVTDIKERSHDLSFMQQLVAFVPESEGFARTQKALLQEVQALRSKIGERMKGRLHILVDTKTNKLFIKQGVNLLLQADCSVGRGGTLKDKRTGRRWEFVTPRGKFKVLAKVENPVWHKPDWAFVETGETPPPPNDPKRRAPGELGAYVLSLGDGYLIHGTRNEELLGQAVSHGCVRLGAENLAKVYHHVPVGTEVYIY